MARWRGINRDHVFILVARDRTGGTRDFVPGRGSATKEQLHRDLLFVLDKDVLLVTDSHAAYRAFVREAGISHQAVNLRAASGSVARCTCRTSMRITAAFANGCRVSTALPRATCRTT